MTAIEDARAALAREKATDGNSLDWIKAMGDCKAALHALIAEHERLTSEMHQRELHHFETEKMLVQAGLDPDAAPPTDDEREALVELTEALRDEFLAWGDEPGEDTDLIIRLRDVVLRLGFRRQGPITDAWERRTENRIHYRYGVNSGTYSAWPHGVTASHDEQQRRLESETSGPVDVTLRESRTVVYGPWEPVETDAD